MRKEINELWKFFSDEEVVTIKKIINEIKNNTDYKTINFWEFDQHIGGIGGYCQGVDLSKFDCFRGMDCRNAYRSLQYARFKFDQTNANDLAREIIMDAGRHLEYSIKLLAKKSKILGTIRYDRKALGELVRSNILEKELNAKVEKFVHSYNIAKHEIESNEELDRTFNADDAILYYFASRVVGKEIMSIIDEENEKEIYEICYEKFGRRIDRF